MPQLAKALANRSVPVRVLECQNLYWISFYFNEFFTQLWLHDAPLSPELSLRGRSQSSIDGSVYGSLLSWRDQRVAFDAYLTSLSHGRGTRRCYSERVLSPVDLIIPASLRRQDLFWARTSQRAFGVYSSRRLPFREYECAPMASTNHQLLMRWVRLPNKIGL